MWYAKKRFEPELGYESYRLVKMSSECNGLVGKNIAKWV